MKHEKFLYLVSMHAINGKESLSLSPHRHPEGSAKPEGELVAQANGATNGKESANILLEDLANVVH